MKDGKFNEEYLKIEKENLKKVIESKIDNKAVYALNRCIENMYDNKGFGIYKYGYLEDVDNIDNSSISDSYKNLINNSFLNGRKPQQALSGKTAIFRHSDSKSPFPEDL